MRLFGQTLGRNGPRLRRRIGVLAETQHFYGEMTAREYLSFFADLYGAREKGGRIAGLLDRLDLGRYRDLRLIGFSKGMQQKLGLARAFVHDPALLILDEPVSSLDPYGIKQVRDLILEENGKGKTFIISSHLLSEIEKTCRRVGILNRGTLLVEGSMDGIIDRVAQGMELELELESVPAGTLAALQRLPYVESLTDGGRILGIHLRGPDDRRAEIARILMDHGCVVLSMRRKRMNLEEAFITITENNLSLLAGKAVAR